MHTHSAIFTNGRVLTPAGLIDDAAVTVENGQIKSITSQNEADTKATTTYDLNGDLLLPGFIDTQVNGGGGVLFNDIPTVEGIQAIGRAHQQFGTTGFLPTLISDDLDVVAQALNAGEQAIEQGLSGVLGVHIEGPFLNPVRRGVHDTSKLQQLTAAIVDTLEPLSNGKTIITLAPEAVSSNAISALRNKGFIVCIGHTNASYEEAIDALEQGATGFTHLFNAMSQLSSREPGVVGAALEDRNSWCGIIADGHHINPVSLRIALRCKSLEKMMLVTDAMSSVGSNQTQFKLQDKLVQVSAGVCRDQDGTLAGSALSMSDAVFNIMKLADVELPIAVEMASKNPADFLGLNHRIGSIEVGKQADFVVADSELNVKATWSSGNEVYNSSQSTAQLSLVSG